MTGLRLLGAAFLIIIVIGYTVPLSGAVIVAISFWVGLGGILLWIVYRMIGRRWR